MTAFTVATWNVNSLRRRWDHVRKWLSDQAPDLLALQETKVVDDLFPVDQVNEAGYRAVFHGQKAYNGVAILSRTPPVKTRNGIPGFDDPQCRVLLAHFDTPPVAVLNLYVPQGAVVDSEKYRYKLRWLDAVLSYVDGLARRHSRLIVLGDLNIAPADVDVHDPELWRDKVMVSSLERQRFNAMLDIGLIDCFRAANPDEAAFSWWDYRGGAYRANHGLRIDHILAAPMLDCRGCWIDAEPRSWSRPTDHAPVGASFACGD